MIDWVTLKNQTTRVRTTIVRLMENEGHRAEVIPPTWRNHLYWHAGHLVTTPQLLTRGLAGEPLDIPDDQRNWFGKGTSPLEWKGPPERSYEQLMDELLTGVSDLFNDFEGREDSPFATPYETSAGVILRTPAEALSFSAVHDGIHLGLVLSLKRGLEAMDA